MLVLPSRILGSLWQNWAQPSPPGPVPESSCAGWLCMPCPSGQVAPELFAVTNTAGCLWNELMPSAEPLPQS